MWPVSIPNSLQLHTFFTDWACWELKLHIPSWDSQYEQWTKIPCSSASKSHQAKSGTPVLLKCIKLWCASKPGSCGTGILLLPCFLQPLVTFTIGRKRRNQARLLKGQEMLMAGSSSRFTRLESGCWKTGGLMEKHLSNSHEEAYHENRPEISHLHPYLEYLCMKCCAFASNQ